MKKWGSALALCFCLFAAGISEGADIKLKNDFKVNNPQAVLDAAWAKLPEDTRAAYGPKSKFAETRYISLYKAESADCIIFIAPDETGPEIYEVAAFLYPDLELVEIGSALISDWDGFYRNIDEISAPGFAP